MNHVRLDQLFTRCDTKGTGFIDRDEFRELCGGFDIGAQDADIIFADLDHDGDGRISYEDFSHGFRDFLTPGSRRGTAQLTKLALSSSSHSLWHQDLRAIFTKQQHSSSGLKIKRVLAL